MRSGNLFSLNRRGGEWNILLLGVMCALLVAVPASYAQTKTSGARYVTALAMLQQYGDAVNGTQIELISTKTWKKHLPYIMATLHQMATPGGQQAPLPLTIKNTVHTPRRPAFLSTSLSSLPIIAVQYNGISTTHYLS